jgi:hypothetical protein
MNKTNDKQWAMQQYNAVKELLIPVDKYYEYYRHKIDTQKYNKWVKQYEVRMSKQLGKPYRVFDDIFTTVKSTNSSKLIELCVGYGEYCAEEPILFLMYVKNFTLAQALSFLHIIDEEYTKYKDSFMATYSNAWDTKDSTLCWKNIYKKTNKHNN